MATPRLAMAAELAQQLLDLSVPATHKLAELSAQLPAVLVPPPRLDFVEQLATWRLVAVAASSDPDTAWEQLDDLVDRVATQLAVETAEAASYALPDGITHPAYVLTVTTTATT